MGVWVKFPFRIFLNVSSAVWDKLFEDVFGLVLYLVWNFVSIIFFRTAVLRSFDFFRVMVLSFGSMLCFRIVRKTFLSM